MILIFVIHNVCLQEFFQVTFTEVEFVFFFKFC